MSNDAERGRLVPGHPNPGHGGLGTGGDVIGHHLGRIHPIDVVGTEHDQVFGIVVVDQVQRLQDGIGTAGVPTRTQSLLRRDRGHVVAQHLAHPPRGGDVPVQRMRLVLRQHADPQVSGVHQVGQDEVDEAEITAEGDGRLCAVSGQRPQPLSLTTSQNDAEHSWFGSHDRTLSGPRGTRPAGLPRSTLNCLHAYSDPHPRVPPRRLRRRRRSRRLPGARTAQADRHRCPRLR